MLAGFFARRYLFSRKSHSVINVISGVSAAAVSVPVAAMVILLSVFNGFDGLVKRMYTDFDPDVMASPVRGKTFAATDSLRRALAAADGVAAASFIVEQNVMAEYRGGQYIATVRGVDSLYADVIPVRKIMSAGEYDLGAHGMYKAVIGRGIAYSLGVGLALDDPLTLYAPRRGNFNPILPIDSYRSESFIPAGTFALDAETDTKYIIAPIEAVRNLLDYPGAATAIAVKLIPGADQEKTKAALRAVLGDNFRVLTRYEQKASFYRIMKYEKWSIFMIVTLVLVIAAFSVAGSLVMLIIDKREDIKTLVTLGSPVSLVRKIFARQAMMIAAAGAAAGIITGITVCLLQQYFGIIKIPAETFLIDAYPVEIQASDIAVTIASIAAISYAIIKLTTIKTIPKTTIRL